MGPDHLVGYTGTAAGYASIAAGDYKAKRKKLPDETLQLHVGDELLITTTKRKFPVGMTKWEPYGVTVQKNRGVLIIHSFIQVVEQQHVS
jgi:hypothetical protein